MRGYQIVMKLKLVIINSMLVIITYNTVPTGVIIISKKYTTSYD